ncbi:MAG: hypothetical protein P8127_00725 [Acidobacteriota bacterium]
MVDREHWNWDTGKKLVCDLRAIEDRLEQVHEWIVSPDGERIAAPVLTAPDVFRVSVNEELWDGEFEKAWHLVFAPDGRLTALVRIDDEWTMAIEGAPWDKRWEFAWNPVFNRDGSVIAVQIKDNMEYGVAVNGDPWEQKFHSSRGSSMYTARSSARTVSTSRRRSDSISASTRLPKTPRPGTRGSAASGSRSIGRTPTVCWHQCASMDPGPSPRTAVRSGTAVSCSCGISG